MFTPSGTNSANYTITIPVNDLAQVQEGINQNVLVIYPAKALGGSGHKRYATCTRAVLCGDIVECVSLAAGGRSPWHLV